jgi:hypothetical protein
MSRNYTYIIGVLFVIGLTVGACSKKDRDPRLIINVIENDGTPANGAFVHVWPGPDAGQPGSTINDELMDQNGYTDPEGNLTFNFWQSAVLDVDVVYYKNYYDTLLNLVTDTMYGHRVVKIESVRQSSDENNFYETVEVQ